MITKLEYEWELEEALNFIRQLQPIVKKYNFHLGLAGGVLNNGYSYKDLDIICMGMHKNDILQKEDLIQYLENNYDAKICSSEEYDMDTRVLYKMNFNNKAIDLFIYE